MTDENECKVGNAVSMASTTSKAWYQQQQQQYQQVIHTNYYRLIYYNIRIIYNMTTVSVKLQGNATLRTTLLSGSRFACGYCRIIITDCQSMKKFNVDVQ